MPADRPNTERVRLTIRHPNGTLWQTPGYRITEHFGIDYRRQAGAWCVTHLPSGLNIACLDTAEAAAVWAVTVEEIASRPELLSERDPHRARDAWGIEMQWALGDVQKGREVVHV